MIKVELKTKIGMTVISEHLICFQVHVPGLDKIYSMKLKEFICMIKNIKVIKKHCQ